MFDKFTEHPTSRGMSYAEHMEHAMNTAIECYKISWALMIHAWFPFWYKDYASEIIKELAKHV